MMELLRWLRLRARGLFGHRSHESGLNNEMHQHLEMLVEEKVAEGLSPRDARLAAQREFGAIDAYREACRDTWRFAWVSALAHDLRHSARSLRRSPGFAATATLTLALGIGACTTMFSVIQSVLLNPLPVRDQDKLVYFWENKPEQNITRFSSSAANFLDYRRETESFEQLAGFASGSASLSSPGNPSIQVPTIRISAGFSDLFGWRLLQGRDFSADEDQPGGPPVAIIDARLWRERYNGDRQILQRTINLDRTPHQIIGVIESSPELVGRADVWRPLAPNPTALPRGDRRLGMMGRLADGVTLDQAQAEVDLVAASLRETYPRAMEGWGGFLEPVYHVMFPQQLRNALNLLFAAVGILLLTACANVANLLLSRALAREREIGVRTALGATRRQLVRQLLCETTVIALAGGLLGIALATGGISLLRSIAPHNLPRIDEIALDWHGLAFAATACVFTTFATGLLPALHGTRSNPASVLGAASKTIGFSRGKSRLRSGLVIAQLALSVSLVVGAGLLLNSFHQLQKVDPGYRADNVLTFEIAPDRTAYSEPDQRLSLYKRLADRLRNLPGVAGVSLSSGVPFGHNQTSNPFSTFDDSTLPPDEAMQVSWRIAAPDYFEVMQIGLVEGRSFTETDDSFDAPVLIINRSLAETLWPGESALGKRTKPTPGGAAYEVVGVVEDIRLTDLTGATEKAQIYFPINLWTFWESMAFVVRTHVPPETLSPLVHTTIQSIDPQQPVHNFHTLEELTHQNLQPYSLNSWLLGVFAGLALLLTAVGIYAVMHSSVTQRTREIGVRMAIGARRGQVLAMVFRQGGRLVLFGLALGGLLAWRFALLLETQLFATAPTDVRTYLAAGAVIAIAGLCAILFPALRATKVDPVIALRSD